MPANRLPWRLTELLDLQTVCPDSNAGRLKSPIASQKRVNVVGYGFAFCRVTLKPNIWKRGLSKR